MQNQIFPTDLQLPQKSSVRNHIKWANPASFFHQFLLFFCMGSLLALSACTTHPVKEWKSVDEGQWSGKLLIKDLAKGTSHLLSLDIVALQSRFLRIDVQAGMGIALFSLVQKEAKVQYALWKEKKYYQGEATERALYPLLGVALPLEVVHLMLFDEVPPPPGWTCERRGVAGDRCKSERSQAEVIWNERTPYKSVLTIKAGAFSSSSKVQIQISINYVKAKVENSNSIFELDVPSNFIQIKPSSRKASSPPTR